MGTVLIVLAIVLIAAVALLATAARRPVPAGRHFRAPQEPITGLAEHQASLPPVLRPERPRALDVDQVRFSLGLRGYRCDQVDDVLDVLSGEISRLENEIRELRDRRVTSDTTEN